MPSGKRMGNESICVLAMRCLLAFLQHLFGTGQQRLLLVGPHAVQSSREGSHQGQQIVRQFLLRRFFCSWFQNGEGHAKTRKQDIYIFLPESRQAIRRGDRNFADLILYDQREQARKVPAACFESRANVLAAQAFVPQLVLS